MLSNFKNFIYSSFSLFSIVLYRYKIIIYSIFKVNIFIKTSILATRVL